MVKRVEIAASVAVPAMFFLQTTLSMSMVQVGGLLGFLRPAMPVLSDIIGFFGNLLIPLGRFFGTLLEGPLQTISSAIPARSPTGYALYFLIFAGILVVALVLNVVWRPLGYATADSRAKREAREARESERAGVKEAARVEARARRKGGKKEKALESVEADAKRGGKYGDVPQEGTPVVATGVHGEPEEPPSETFVDHGNDPDKHMKENDAEMKSVTDRPDDLAGE